MKYHIYKYLGPDKPSLVPFYLISQSFKSIIHFAWKCDERKKFSSYNFLEFFFIFNIYLIAADKLGYVTHAGHGLKGLPLLVSFEKFGNTKLTFWNIYHNIMKYNYMRLGLMALS